MAIANRSDLHTAIGEWFLNRGSDLAARYDDFVLFAESRFNYGVSTPDGRYNSPPLRVSQMEEDEELTLDANGDATLPTDFLEARYVETASGGATYGLEHVTPGRMTWNYPTRYGGTAAAFQRTAGGLRVSPTTGPVTLYYYAKIPALTEANPTNWLLTAYPQVYLYACLFEAALYTADDALAQQYYGLMVGHLNGLMTSDKASRWSRATARVMGPTP